ncbi:MAG: putative membrane protein, partial [Candidatus Daviesbacteria bacterium GW2011_GWA2_40_9]
MQIKQAFLFITILGTAAYFRFTGIYWDGNAHLHPDERFLTMVTTNISLPTSISEYFDTAHSPANPHNKDASFYVYGTYPVHFTKLVAQLFNKDTYDDRTPVSRGLSGIVDLLTLIVVFLLAYAVSNFSRGAGRDLPAGRQGTKNLDTALIAMFCYAVMVTPIQLSHFYTVDPYTTLFITIALYRIIRGKFDVWLGIALGLAIGAKISSVIFLPIVGIAFLLSWKKKNIVRDAIVVAITTMATVRISYPYLFVGWKLNPLVLNNWKELKGFGGPSTGFPPALQWFGVPFWQPSLDMIVWGLGIPLGIIAVMAILYHVSRVRRHATNGIILLLLWIVFLLLYQSAQFAKAMRYLWPIYPAIAVLCGLFLSRIRISYILALPALLALLIWPFAFT